jgi:molybdopterin-guanine dinucleotide biosynthesis protein A
MIPITLAILAGGQGSRMGIPKAQIHLHGQPILEHLLLRFNWPGPTLLVTAPGREHPPGAASFSREVIDPLPAQGPLRGLLTALENAQTDQTIVATVDMPAITSTHLNHLITLLDQHPAFDAVMLRRSDAPADSLEPFPSIYRTSATPIVRAQLQSGHPSMHALARHPRIKVLPAPADWPPLVWTNLNHPSELEDYLRLQPDQPDNPSA